MKAIVRSVIPANRIYIRDQKTYCGILVDDNNRRPLARLHFNGRTKAVSLFDGEKEERVKIESLDNIYDHTDRLRSTAQRYVADTSGAD